jgi:hypothetical protein
MNSSPTIERNNKLLDAGEQAVRKSPRVSVTMPVYNGEIYLSETMESVLNQTFTDFEFIIIDDASTDGSWEVLSAYAARDSRIALSRNLENLGHRQTSNKTLALAQGHFIARQDQDDISLPDRLALQVAYLQQHPKVGLLSTAYFRQNSQGQRKFRQPPLTHTEIRWKLLFGNVLPHSSIMIRRELFQNGEPGYQEVSGPQDYDLWSRLVKRTHAATLPVPLLVYREHDTGMTALYAERQDQAIVTISTQQLSPLLPHYSLSPAEINALWRLHSPRNLSQKEMAMSRIMFELFDAFEQQPDVDPDMVRTIRRHWIKRVLTAIPANQWQTLWTSGLFQMILRYDPMAVLSTGLIHLPKRTIRRIKNLSG